MNRPFLARDASGRSRHGVLGPSAGLTSGPLGVAQTAIQTNNVSVGYVTFSNPSFANLHLDAFTIAVYYSSIVASNVPVFEFTNYVTYGLGFWQFPDTNRVSAPVHTTLQHFGCQLVPWTFVALVFNNATSTFTIYCGLQRSTSVFTDLRTPTMPNLVVGAR